MNITDLTLDEKNLINNLLVKYQRELMRDIKNAVMEGVPNYEEYENDKIEEEIVINLIKKIKVKNEEY